MHEILALKRAYNTKLHSILGHESVIKRLSKALEILTSDPTYSWVSTDGEWYITRHGRVASNTETEAPYAEYIVNLTNKTCTCPDSEGRGNYCKHRLAMELWEMAIRGPQARQGLQGPRAPFVRYVGPTKWWHLGTLLVHHGDEFQVVEAYPEDHGVLVRSVRPPIYTLVLDDKDCVSLTAPLSVDGDAVSVS